METSNRKSAGGKGEAETPSRGGWRESLLDGLTREPRVRRREGRRRRHPYRRWPSTRLSRLQEQDRAPRMPPLRRGPAHHAAAVRVRPGDSPTLLPPPLLLLVPRSPLVCPLDSLGHCCALVQAGPSSSHRFAGDWAAAAPGLPGDRASEPGPGPGEGRADGRAACLGPIPLHSRRSGQLTSWGSAKEAPGRRQPLELCGRGGWDLSGRGARARLGRGPGVHGAGCAHVLVARSRPPGGR